MPEDRCADYSYRSRGAFARAGGRGAFVRPRGQGTFVRGFPCRQSPANSGTRSPG